ncbi:MAG: LamG-like jellyroll fold domain-containing protein [Limisphaerales bacterium]
MANGNNVLIYINGELAANTTFSNPINVPNGTFTIAQDVTDSAWFSGQIDEVQVWNVARPAAFIQSDMRSKPSLPSPGLVSYHDFDEGYAYFLAPVEAYLYDRGMGSYSTALHGNPQYVPGVAVDVPVSSPQGRTLVMPVGGRKCAGDKHLWQCWRLTRAIPLSI